MKSKYEVYINEEKGIVVAKLSKRDFEFEVGEVALKKVMAKVNNSSINPTKFGAKMLPSYVYSYYDDWISKKNINSTVVTRAKCNFEEGDKFVEEIGVYIATNRMDVKIAEMAFEFLCDFYEGFMAFLMDVIGAAEKLGEYSLKTIDHISYLSTIQDN